MATLRKGFEWDRNEVSTTGGIGGLELRSGTDAAAVPQYVFDGTGRISTGSAAGAALTFPTTYLRGEAIEARYTSSFTASQFQGVFMEVRSDVANTSTIRGMEIRARQGAAVAIGALEGANINAFIASTSTGNIGTVFGASGEVQVDDTYTGTVTLCAAMRAKIAKEDGATYTGVNAAMTAGSYGLLIQGESVTGLSTSDAAIGITNAPADVVAFNVLIDARGTRLSQAAANRPNVFVINDAGTLFRCDINTGTGAWTCTSI